MSQPGPEHERQTKKESKEINTNEEDQETMSRRRRPGEILVDALAGGLNYEAAGDLAVCRSCTVPGGTAEAEFARRVSNRRGERGHGHSGSADVAQMTVDALAAGMS